MRKTALVFLFFFIIVSTPAVKLTAGESILIHADIGTYNRQYKDKHYLDHNETSFGMEQTSYGVEYSHINPEKVSAGGGFALTNMQEGEQWNLNRYETHPLTLVLVPYIFAGYSFENFGCELGISCYLQFSRHDPILYYLPDGSVTENSEEGIRLDRSHSHAFINAKLRFFNEKSLHCKIRIGRENFDPVDSLINLSVLYPLRNHIFEYYISFLTLDNYLYTIFNQDNILKTNQTTGLCYSYDFGVFTLGLKGGILLYNGHGGGKGDVPLTNRLSGGVFTTWRW